VDDVENMINGYINMKKNPFNSQYTIDFGNFVTGALGTGASLIIFFGGSYGTIFSLPAYYGTLAAMAATDLVGISNERYNYYRYLCFSFINDYRL